MRDYALETTFDIKFTTRRFSTGAPFTLAGTPVISAYPDNSITQLTAGITLTVDFDGVTGLHNVRVVATAVNGYAAGSNYALVITAGTVDGVSVVGEVIGEFSLESQSALKPTVAGRKLDVNVNGEAGIDWANVGSPTTVVGLSGTTISTSQAVASVAGAVGSVTGAVGSVTGAVGSVAGAVGSIAAGGIAATSFAAGAINAAAIATGAIDSDAIDATAVTEIQAGLATPTNITAATGITVATNNDKAGYSLATAPPTATEIWTLANGIETGITPQMAMRAIGALAGILSGAATSTNVLKGLDGTTTRITATVDSDGNRTAVTFTLT